MKEKAFFIIFNGSHLVKKTKKKQWTQALGLNVTPVSESLFNEVKGLQLH